MALAVMFVALEWTQREKEDNSDIFKAPDIVLDQEQIPITMPEKKTVPPPPAAVSNADVIEIVENDSEEPEDVMASVEDNVEWHDMDEVEVFELEPEPEVEEIFMVVEDAPEFPGGTEALLKYLREHIKYPPICRENNIQGRVLVSFVVNKDGSIVDPEIVKGVNPSLDKEALRVIAGMPNWKPGKQRGKEVRVKFTVPVNFRLNFCIWNGRLYTALCHDKDSPVRGRIRVYGEELDFIAETSLPKDADGITCIGGVLYVGLGPAGTPAEPYRGNWFCKYDATTLKPLCGPFRVDHGCDCCSGVQNLCTDGENVYMNVYCPDETADTPNFIVFDRAQDSRRMAEAHEDIGTPSLAGHPYRHQAHPREGTELRMDRRIRQAGQDRGYRYDRTQGLRVRGQFEDEAHQRSDAVLRRDRGFLQTTGGEGRHGTNQTEARQQGGAPRQGRCGDRRQEILPPGRMKIPPVPRRVNDFRIRTSCLWPVPGP